MLRKDLLTGNVTPTIHSKIPNRRLDFRQGCIEQKMSIIQRDAAKMGVEYEFLPIEQVFPHPVGVSVGDVGDQAVD